MKLLIVPDELSGARLAAVSVLETLLHCATSVSVVSSVLLEVMIPNQAQTLPGTYEYFSLPMQSFFPESWAFSALSKVEQAAQAVSIDLTKGSYKGGRKRGVG